MSVSKAMAVPGNFSYCDISYRYSSGNGGRGAEKWQEAGCRLDGKLYFESSDGRWDSVVFSLVVHCSVCDRICG